MKFKLVLKLKDCEKDFGLGPGVLVEQEVDFEATEKDLDNPMFISSLLREEDEFIKRHIEVDILKGVIRSD